MAKKHIVKVPQIARICGLTEESIRQWCRTKWLKSVKTSNTGEWIIYREDLVEHFSLVERHLEFLLNSVVTRKSDVALKSLLLKEIAERMREDDG